MTPLVIANAILGIMEFLCLTGCQWYFMSQNGRTIFRKKGWYVLGFVLYLTGQFAANAGGIGAMVFAADLLLTLAAVWCLFTRTAGAVILNLFLNFCLALAATGVNLAVSILFAGMEWDVYLAADIGLGVKMLVYLLLIKLFLLGRSKEQVQALRPAVVIVTCMVPAASIFYLVSLAMVGNIYLQMYGVKLIFVNIVVLLVVNGAFFWLMNDIFRASRIRQEMELFQKQSDLQYRYYAELEKKYRESRKLIHDMKNHLQAVERLYKEQETEKGEGYVRDLYHMLNTMGEKYYSANRMLNIILNEKLDQAKKLGIAVQASVGDVDLSDIRDIDLTAVFANLLDNAVEAAGQTEDGFLHIKINEVQGFRVASLENSMKESEEGQKKPGHMGLGLSNVEKTLERYHGTMEVEKRNGVYKVILMIPK